MKPDSLPDSTKLDKLPKHDYYNRPVAFPINQELNHLIQGSRARLYALIQTFPEQPVFEPDNFLQITAIITRMEEQIKTCTEQVLDHQNIQNRITILKDLKKINELRYITIPQDNEDIQNYCVLSEPVGGVTEKISLIRFECVKHQLEHLIHHTETSTVEDYIEKQEQYQLHTEAIIKLPKRGSINEIQHEAVALNISHIMGLDTTDFTLVSYNDQPALFIPFTKIRLLNEFTTGKKFAAGLGLFGHTYTDYSTIKPFGEGLQADSYIEDFGKAMGLFYLCSDPDGIGGYCQNKGLKNNKTLFIFDQIFSDSVKFIIDSQFNLHAATFFMWKTRHTTGRNRTLIEDSSFNVKYESITQLKTLKPKLQHYLQQIIELYQKQAEHIRADIPTLINQLQTLTLDAKLLKKQITERINAVAGILPQESENIDAITVRQTLVLEKLLKRPKLFHDDGRPYKNPWVSDKSIHILRIEDNKDQLKLYFNEAIPESMLEFLKRHGAGDSLKLESPETLCIHKDHLHHLQEDMIYPEHQLTLVHHIDYLCQADLARLLETYHFGNRHRINCLIETYRDEMRHLQATPAEKIKCIQETENNLIKLINTAQDKGFGKHVLKKFYFDAQKMLQTLMNPSQKPACIDDAFCAALRLDRVAEFNTVVLEAVKYNKLDSPPFIAFLESCMSKAIMATNYNEAYNESTALLKKAQKVREYLQKGSSIIDSELLQILVEDSETVLVINRTTDAPIIESVCPSSHS